MNSIQKHLLKSTYRKPSRPIKIIVLNHGLNKTRPYVKRSYFTRNYNIFRKGFDSHMRKLITLQLKNVNKLKGRYTRGVLLPEHARGSFCTGGGALGYFLGGYVPSGTPNWHPVLKKKSPKIDTPF